MEKVEHELNDPVDQTRFRKELTVAGVRVQTSQISATMTLLKPILLARKGKRNVYADTKDGPDRENFKVIALSEGLSQADAQKKLDELAKDRSLELVSLQIELDFPDYNYFEALKMLLPDHVTTPSGFETIGHIAHLNLRENQLPWKYLIGQVIREKTKEIKTVVNKKDKLHNEYRTPELELISGDLNYETVVHEEGTNLWLDFEKVYWCSRLHAERSRVLKTLLSTDVICDAFCGVGPFAVRAAREKGCRVFASDLNPHGTEYLKKNIKVNKVTHLVESGNECARTYIQKTLARVFAEEIPKVTRWFMNLPGDAIEFLDAFTAYFQSHPEQTVSLTRSQVHVYCFLQKEADLLMREKLVARVQKVMPNFSDEDILDIHTLKSVSSDKDMCCLTFKLHAGNVDPQVLGQPTKQLKVD